MGAALPGQRYRLSLSAIRVSQQQLPGPVDAILVNTLWRAAPAPAVFSLPAWVRYTTLGSAEIRRFPGISFPRTWFHRRRLPYFNFCPLPTPRGPISHGTTIPPEVPDH